MSYGASIGTVPSGKSGKEALRNIPSSIQTFKPNVMLSVPTLAKNFKKNIENSIKKSGKTVERLYNFALKNAIAYHKEGYNRGTEFVDIFRKPLMLLFDKIIFKKVREGLGGQMKFFVGGGALLDIDLQRYYCAIGIPMYQGYGLSEATPIISANAQAKHIFGSSGKVVQPMEIKILDADGNELPFGEGLKFYLLPDFKRFTEAGIGNVVVAAMNQGFFSLSLGIGSMAIFGSYLKKDRSLMGEAVNVICLDTFVALTAGLIIFPACSAFGVEAGSGPSLVFITLPNIFNNMAGGRIWGSLFFLFMSFAALSTVFAVFENIVACLRDLTGWERKKASWATGIALMVLCMPCVLGFTVLSHITILGLSIMDFEDFVVSNLMLPIGSLMFALFCVTRYGWGWKNFVAEANTGKGAKVQNWMRLYMTYVVPVIIAFIFFYGLYNFFK